MKKVLFVFLILAAIAFVGTLSIQAIGNINNSDYDYDGYMMDEMDSYEFMYIQLSDSNRATVDQAFAQLLIDNQASTMTTDDLVALIDNFKNDMLDQYDVSFTYGMGMMGYAYNQDNFDLSSYGWYYIHLDEEDQALIDTKYASLLQEIDYTNLTANDLVAELDDVNQAVITYIQTL